MAEISIKGLNKADVLAALYNASRAQGMGFLQYNPEPMSREEAEKLLSHTRYFDYLKGRVMKISLESDVMVETRSYDRDNGQGAGERVIDQLRQARSVNTEEIQKQHKQGTTQAALDLLDRMDTPTTVESAPGLTVINLGMEDVKEHLKPVIDRVTSSDE